MNLPIERAALSPSGSLPPEKAFGMPTVRKCLLDPEVIKRCDPTRLLHAARKTIASYPAGVSTIYTIGSVQTLESNCESWISATSPSSNSTGNISATSPSSTSTGNRFQLHLLLLPQLVTDFSYISFFYLNW
ncbi:colorectal mutant cancer protein [Biomphalaria glabrata]